MSTSLFAELFAALDMVVMKRQSAGVFLLIGPAPDWFKKYYPDVRPRSERLRPGDWFPFLDNFLVDAELFWRNQSTGQLQSGPWAAGDRFGHEHFLEAVAVCLGERQILLLTFADREYAEKQSIIQKARDNNLACSRFSKELHHKEVLLHCIVHDLSGPLTSIILGLSLLETDTTPDVRRNTVATCLLQAQKQQKMIGQILEVFAAEQKRPGGPAQGPATAPDVRQCVQYVHDAVHTLCIRKQVTLRLHCPADQARDWRVAGESSRLERIIFNLVENAIRHSPPQTVISIRLSQEVETIRVTVDDEGPGVPGELVSTMFDKFSQAQTKPGKAGLGLYFCRTTIEGWGGTLGYTPRPTGGARFWFRLPRFTPGKA